MIATVTKTKENIVYFFVENVSHVGFSMNIITNANKLTLLHLPAELNVHFFFHGKQYISNINKFSEVGKMTLIFELFIY